MKNLDLFFGTFDGAPPLYLQPKLGGIDVCLGVLECPPLEFTELTLPGAANAAILCVVSVLDTVVILPALGTLRCGIQIARCHQRPSCQGVPKAAFI